MCVPVRGALLFCWLVYCRRINEWRKTTRLEIIDHVTNTDERRQLFFPLAPASLQTLNVVMVMERGTYVMITLIFRAYRLICERKVCSITTWKCQDTFNKKITKKCTREKTFAFLTGHAYLCLNFPTLVQKRNILKMLWI